MRRLNSSFPFLPPVPPLLALSLRSSAQVSFWQDECKDDTCPAGDGSYASIFPVETAATEDSIAAEVDDSEDKLFWFVLITAAMAVLVLGCWLGFCFCCGVGLSNPIYRTPIYRSVCDPKLSLTTRCIVFGLILSYPIRPIVYCIPSDPFDPIFSIVSDPFCPIVSGLSRPYCCIQGHSARSDPIYRVVSYRICCVQGHSV